MTEHKIVNTTDSGPLKPVISEPIVQLELLVGSNAAQVSDLYTIP